ncbi:hypothetical protein ACSEE7_16360, partial [Halomonas cupida]|uniref:hypothetical protein n=1 Tax=Halomonas cupida TaxID=44933 RepID=UPI003EF53BB4
ASCKRCLHTSKESEACLSASFDALSATPIKWRAFYRFLVARQAVIFPRSFKKPFQINYFHHSSPPVTFARRRQRMRTLRISRQLGNSLT